MHLTPNSSANKTTFPRTIACLMGLLLAYIVLLFSGCQSSNKVVTVHERWVAPARGCLAPGDVVKLSFSGASEYNQTQKIRTDGRISLPMVGEIVADGKKPGDLQRELAALYKPQLQNNEVVVAVESNAVPVYVSGFVNKPGRILVDRPTTVLEAIMEAGGFQSGFANPKKVILLRNANGKHIPSTLDLSAALKGKAMDAIYVNANDVIYVPESLF